MFQFLKQMQNKIVTNLIFTCYCFFYHPCFPIYLHRSFTTFSSVHSQKATISSFVLRGYHLDPLFAERLEESLKMFQYNNCSVSVETVLSVMEQLCNKIVAPYVLSHTNNTLSSFQHFLLTLMKHRLNLPFFNASWLIACFENLPQKLLFCRSGKS